KTKVNLCGLTEPEICLQISSPTFGDSLKTRPISHFSKYLQRKRSKPPKKCRNKSMPPPKRARLSWQSMRSKSQRSNNNKPKEMWKHRRRQRKHGNHRKKANTALRQKTLIGII